MTQPSFEVTHYPKAVRLSERAVAHLLLAAIVISQIAWVAILGWSAWQLMFG